MASMTSTTRPHPSRTAASTVLPGFWSEVRSLTNHARQIETLTPKALRAQVIQGPSSKRVVVTWVREIDALFTELNKVRARVEALEPNPRVPSAPQNALRSDVRAGNLLDAATFAGRLDWTRQALSKALAARRVFCVEVDGQRYFPACYADPRYERKQIEAVTKILGDLPGGAKWQFFTTPKGSLGRRTPLQALAKGGLAQVKAAAEGFAQG